MGTWALRHLAAASVAFDTRPLARDDWPLFEGPGPEPPPFEYEASRNADEAVALLASMGIVRRSWPEDSACRS